MSEAPIDEQKLYEAIKPYLVPFESHPDVIGVGLSMIDDQYVVRVMVRNLADATRNRVEDVVPSPLIVTVDNSHSVPLSVHFEEIDDFILGH